MTSGTMGLAEYESRALALCFAAEVSDAELAEIGNADRWRTYRNMVRARLRKVCANAFPRALDAMGEERFDALFVAWLAEAGVTHRYFREVPIGFLEHASPALANAEPWLLDLARYELATWRVKLVDDRDEPEVVEIDFDRPIALNVALEVLETSHEVHQPIDGHAYPAERSRYAIYRAADFRAVTMILTPMAHALLSAWCADSSKTLTEQVQHVTAARGRAVDARFVDGLSTMLADFIERGIVRGSLRPSTTEPKR